VAAITEVVIPIFIGWSIAFMGGASTSSARGRDELPPSFSLSLSSCIARS
jgi:hypothetical protein